jgi:hypothetical protein
MTEANTLRKNRPFPGDSEVDDLLKSIEAELDSRIRKYTQTRRRIRRFAWGAGGIAVAGMVGLALTGAFNPIGSIFDPDGGGTVYLQINCYANASATAATATFSADQNDSAMQAQRLDPAAVCTQMNQRAAIQRDLTQIQLRPDVQTAGSAIVYAKDGSVWNLYRDNGGWSITGGPDPIPEVGHPQSPNSLPAPASIRPATVVIRNFKFAFPPALPQAVCVKNDVEFDVIVTSASDNSSDLCAARGMDSQK